MTRKLRRQPGIVVASAGSFRCRCGRDACRARQTKRMHPDAYLRRPKCRACKVGTIHVDRYRNTREENANPCKCSGYSFPHARGRGWCEHSTKWTAEDLHERMRTMGARYA